jgi:uncharacterized membrane protein
MSAPMGRSRLETFSDGVFAIAITLLVLTISEPTNYADLGHELALRWPSFIAYVVSFAVIGIMWLNHHTVFTYLRGVDRTFIFLNLFLLMTIAFLPYPTGVLGLALGKGQGTGTAAIAYGVTMAVNALAWVALWLYASGRRRLLADSFPEEQRRTATVLFTAGALLYGAALGLAFVGAYAFLAVQGALAVYYALDPIARWLARSHGSEGPIETQGAPGPGDD